MKVIKNVKKRYIALAIVLLPFLALWTIIDSIASPDTNIYPRRKS